MANYLGTLSASLISGLAGAKVMEPTQEILMDMQPEESKKREEAVSPGNAMELAAERVARSFGVELSKSEKEQGGIAVHYGISAAGGLLYTAIRQNTGWNPLFVGLLTGLLMAIILDEGFTWAAGLAADPRLYPKETHIRAIVSHLTYGIGVAIVAETLGWVGRRFD